MKVATFNANSIRSRLHVILRWLAAHRPDVLGLQETKVVDEEFPLQPLVDAGYHVAFRGQKSYSGVALLSRVKPSELRFGLDDGEQKADESRLVYAKIGGVRFLNCYVPQGRDIEHEQYRYKLRWLKRLRSYLERHCKPSQQVLWMGDLNVTPEAIDIYNSEKQLNHVAYHVDARKAFAGVVDWGFVDVFRKHHPEAGQFTYFDYRLPDAAKAGRGWRPDHIFATPSLARRSLNAYIDLKPRLGPTPSDHTFLVAEFRD